MEGSIELAGLGHEQTGASGEPTTVADNGVVIAQQVSAFNEAATEQWGYDPEFTGSTPTATGCGGCDGSGGVGTWTVAGLVALLVRRRR